MNIPNDFHQTPPAADGVSWDAPAGDKKKTHKKLYYCSFMD